MDFSKHKLTTENIKKVKSLRKSKSVENWLNSLETHQNHEDNIELLNNNIEHHYACVDVTGADGNTHFYNQHQQKRLFARSNVIFESYSSYNVNF